jgi:hypothetical protein
VPDRATHKVRPIRREPPETYGLKRRSNDPSGAPDGFPRLAALVAAAALTSVAAGFGLATPQRAEAAAPPKGDPVIESNRTLLQIIRTPGAQPATVHPTRNLAIMHLAILPGVQRSFATFSAVAQGAGLIRIYAGQRTCVDHAVGVALGRNVAHYMLRHDLQPR